MLNTLAKNRWWLVVRGIAAIVFGVLALLLPGITLLTLVILVGAYSLADGIAALVLAFRRKMRERAGVQKAWPLVFIGIAGIAAGVITFLWPGITALALLAIFAAWSIVRGVFELIAAVKLRRQIEGEWMLGLSGLLSVIVGVLLIAQPLAGLVVLAWLIGVYALVVGVLYIVLAVKLGHIERPADHMAHA